MYIDFHKYNYELIPKKERERYIQRDKKAYKNILRNWLEKNIDSIVERKWEIEEILFLSEISDFIKLLKEAETLYGFGFFTSCIALSGISAEDFTKYIATREGKTELVEETQFNRLKILLKEGIIPNGVYYNLDNIRKIRNKCLHYDQEFKLKNEEELKKDALSVLNNFKIIIKSILGYIQKTYQEKFDKLKEITEGIISEEGQLKNADSILYRLRNATSYLFNLPLTFSPEIKTLIFERMYKVCEIDFKFEEVTLLDLTVDLKVIIDLDETIKEKLIQLNVKKNDLIHATVYSEIDKLGLSSSWKFIGFEKIE